MLAFPICDPHIITFSRHLRQAGTWPNFTIATHGPLEVPGGAGMPSFTIAEEYGGFQLVMGYPIAGWFMMEDPKN